VIEAIELSAASHWLWESLSEECRLGLARFDQGEIKPVIGDLFERSFRDPPPTHPVHYVCVCETQVATNVVGYGHCTAEPRFYLGGGMCTDNRALRKLTPSVRSAIAKRGGVAQFLIEGIFQMSKDKAAVFSYVGHPVAIQIDLRSGFLRTEHKHLLVHWTHGAPEDAAKLIHQVHQIGPF
jgi:hypothetical protein